MKFGFATNFAVVPPDTAGITLLPVVAQAGYDFAELPAAAVAQMDAAAFAAIRGLLRKFQLPCLVCNTLFPEDFPIIGANASHVKTEKFLHSALSRLKALGAEKIVFAQVSAWQIPKAGREAGFAILAEWIRSIALPACRQHGMQLLIEPLRQQACDLINTPEDAFFLSRQVNEPDCGIMLDLYHLRENNIHSLSLQRNEISSVGHVHIAGSARALPTGSDCSDLATMLRDLKNAGYTGSMCFETRGPNDLSSLTEAKRWLKLVLDGFGGTAI